MKTPAFASALAVALVASSSTVSATLPIEGPTVSLKNGSYYGLHEPTYNQDHFLGIPYAQPPLGDLRWANPAPLNTTWKGVKNATEYSPMCYGYGPDHWVLGNVVSEDCLTLNVVRPSTATVLGELPVAVWIHGGGFRQGSNRDPRYNLTYIVDQGVKMGKPFIAVGINYRLSGFGFFWGSESQQEGSGNAGFKDQRMALHWVQENIAAFGGDPSKVTIFGESAGGLSVMYHLVAYGGRDDKLFRGAVEQSGGFANSYITASAWDARYLAPIAAKANCTSASSKLACLRALPAKAISDIINSTGVSFPTNVIDGDFLQANVVELLDQGKFVRVPLLNGRVDNEAAGYGAGTNTDEQFKTVVKALGFTDAQADIFLKLYPDIPEIGVPMSLRGRPAPGSPYGTMYKRAAAFVSDNSHATRRYFSKTWAKAGLPNYIYYFNVRPNGVSEYLGAQHFEEVAFVFYNLNGDGYKPITGASPFENTPQSYKDVANMMSRMWVSFFVDQNPNYAGAVQWPPSQVDDTHTIYFDANVTSLAYVRPDTYRAEGINYMHELYHQ